MFRKIISVLVFAVAFFGIGSQIAFAKSSTDWSKVVSLVNSEIAVKPGTGQTVFGKLTSANENEIVVQIADKKGLSNQSKTFQKSDVKKVWSADLRSGGKIGRGVTTGIGAGIGAAAGFGIGIVLLKTTGGSDESGRILAVTTAVGAGLGAALGLLAGKSGHKKGELIYSI